MARSMAGTNGGRKGAVLSDSEEDRNGTKQVSDDDTESTELGEDEYEIDAILDVKTKAGKKGGKFYFVSWKGYGSDDNQWLPEADVQGAPEALATFWKNHPEKKDKKGSDAAEPKRRTMRKTTGGALAATKSSTSKGEYPPGGVQPRSAPPAGRSRVRDTTPPNKKSPSFSPSPSTRKKSTRTQKQLEEVDVPMDPPHGMDEHMTKASWEYLVRKVEGVSNGEGVGEGFEVNLLLKDGSHAVASSKQCNQKCPQKMLAFYESRIKFRAPSPDEANET